MIIKFSFLRCFKWVLSGVLIQMTLGMSVWALESSYQSTITYEHSEFVEALFPDLKSGDKVKIVFDVPMSSAVVDHDKVYGQTYVLSLNGPHTVTILVNDTVRGLPFTIANSGRTSSGNHMTIVNPQNFALPPDIRAYEAELWTNEGPNSQKITLSLAKDPSLTPNTLLQIVLNDTVKVGTSADTTSKLSYQAQPGVRSLSPIMNTNNLCKNYLKNNN